MTNYRLTPAAQLDLSSIWGFTQERWEEVREGYRRYGIGSHLIFYVERTDGVDMIRIPHQRMDPTRHF